MRSLSKNQELVFSAVCAYKKHLTAQEVYHLIHKNNPVIGLTTVYRALEGLEQKGLIQKIVGLDNKVHYDDRLDLHPHFVCRCCGRIEDVDCVSFPISLVEIEHKMCISCEQVELNIHGVCSNCHHLEEN